MDILVTGANGFLGKHILKELANSNIFTLARSSGDLQISLEKEIPNFEFFFEVVIHAAGKAHSVPKSEAEKKEFHQVNVIGTRNLLKGLENSRLPKKFVYISSVAVYGQEVGHNIDETHLLDAKDPYGLSKIEAEQLVIKWCDKNNVTYTILRLPLLVGKNPPGNLGAMLKAIVKGYYFNIGGGKARKSMVLVMDVGLFIMNASSIGGIYNLTDGFHPSFSELSLAISEKEDKRKPWNLPFSAAKFAGKIGDFLGEKAPINSLKIKKITSDLTFDDSKARKMIGWNPRGVLEYLKNNSL